MKLLINGVSSYAPGHAIGPARWPHHDLIIVLEGSLELDCAGQRHTLLAHDALLILPDCPFVGAMGSGGGTIAVQHFSASAGDLPRPFASARQSLVLRGAAASEVVLALFRRLHALREGDDKESVALRVALFHSLLLDLAHASRIPVHHASNEASEMARAIAWAESDIGAATSLLVVARRAGISESHFRSVFRRLRGQTAGDWLRQQRMAEARRLLSSTALTLKAISDEVGFSDPVSFNRSFNRFHGVPPGAYRRRHPRTV
jgi:AraC-like DNA-binding protein